MSEWVKWKPCRGYGRLLAAVAMPTVLDILYLISLLSPFLCFHKPSFFLFICHFSFTLSHISHRIAHPRYICHLLTSELNFLIFCIKIGNLAEIAGFRQIP
jgi:hypothetical protein